MFNFKTLFIAALSAASAFAQFSTPMRDVEHPVRNAVIVEYTCLQASSCSTNYQVPAGFRLVVTQVSVINTAPLAANVTRGYFQFAGFFGGAKIINTFPMENYGTFENFVTTKCFFVADSLITSGLFGSYVRGTTGTSLVQLFGYLYKI